MIEVCSVHVNESISYHLGGRVEPWVEHKPARSVVYPMKHLKCTVPQNSTAEAPGMYGSMLSSGMDPTYYCTLAERSLGLASPIPCAIPVSLPTPQSSRLARSSALWPILLPVAF